MPDKTVRVTSRYPNGRSTVFFDLERGQGFTLEQDQCRSEVFVLRMAGRYGDCAARYGDPSEAEADFADLTTMLGDRHCPPPPALPSSLPTQATHASLPPPSSLGAAKRKGWGWKGAVAGLALGAVGTHFATGWRTTDSGAVHAVALADAVPRPSSCSGDDCIPDARSVIQRQPASPPAPAAPARVQPLSRPPAPAPNFGLQP